jgi:hypothetical protein
LTALTVFLSVGLVLFVLLLSVLAGLYEWSGGISWHLYIYAIFALVAAFVAVFVPKKKEPPCSS